ncbi:MAG TPA: inositol monophosphatase [Candidatus Acidoferrum sp.]|jgi:myo-inositol-1(or 4)-monophosphatase|nr:inositol monophosphatase [Candidatus Acidoferrum sp.]
MSADERVGTAIRERLAADLAVRGGRLALEYFHRAQVSWKPDGSMVTDADLAIQEELATEIAGAFPDDAVVGEEGHVEDDRSSALYSWVLDPVDGTNNFGRGLPGFSVSIGVLRNGQPFAGAVYDPISRWLFTACVGRGAWLNDRPLRTRPAPMTRSSLFSIRTPLEDGVPPFVDEWLRRYRLRRFGSTALHLCYIALGALDLVHDHRASLWDIAGATPVLLEAGGMLTGSDGAALFPATAAHLAGAPISFLAGNPASHAQALLDVAAAVPLSR